MKKNKIKTLIGIAVISIFLAFAVGDVSAEKPGSAGNSKHKEVKGNKVEKEIIGKDRENNQQDASVTLGFGIDDRRSTTAMSGLRETF